MTYETWLLQLKLYLMVNGFMCFDEATRFLTMFDLRKTWDTYQSTVDFYDKYARV